jgi:hypothetical protein
LDASFARVIWRVSRVYDGREEMAYVVLRHLGVFDL